MAKASAGPHERQGVQQRVAAALARGGLRQWLRFDTEGEVRTAKALLATARARHVEALTGAQIAARQDRARATIPASTGSKPPHPGPAAMPEPPQRPLSETMSGQPVPAAGRAARKSGGKPRKRPPPLPAIAAE